MAKYEIGYRRPPVAHRFQKGTSGNPAGRPPKSHADLGEIARKVAQSQVSYSVNGKKVWVTRDRAGLQILVNHAVEGNVSAARQVIRILKNDSKKSSRSLIRVIGGFGDQEMISAAKREGEH